jgi:hypothetical protein
MLKVEGHPNLYRDEKTGAIINYDQISYNQYVNSLNSRESQKKEIINLKNELCEIKLLLKQLLEKNGSISN